MAKFLVNRLVNPVASTHPAGVVIDAPSDVVAVSKFVALHPTPDGTPITLATVKYLTVQSVPQVTIIADPPLPSDNT